MQITITAEEFHGMIHEIVAPLFVAGATWLGKASIRAAVSKLNGIITENVNRLKLELLADFNAKHAENKATLLTHAEDDRRDFGVLREDNKLIHQQLEKFNGH